MIGWFQGVALERLLLNIDFGLKFVHVKGIYNDSMSGLRRLFRFHVIYNMSLESFLLTVEKLTDFDEKSIDSFLEVFFITIAPQNVSMLLKYTVFSFIYR